VVNRKTTAPDIDVLCQGIEHGLDQLVALAQPSTTPADPNRSSRPPKPAPAP
jgi:hypothetical protein